MPLHLHDGPLRFVESDEHCSTYLDRHGDEVYLRHGTARRLVDLDDVDLPHFWNEWLLTNSRYDHHEFLQHLRDSTLDPGRIDDEIGLCDDCHEPDDADDLWTLGNGNTVCESCRSNYWFCADCEEFWRSTTTTLNDREVCSSCLTDNWTFCGECEGYYPDRDADEHAHPRAGEGCCESPAMYFSIRNDGLAPLRNDTRESVTLPAGHISDEGVGAIAYYLREHAESIRDANGDHDNADRLRSVSYSLADLGQSWQTKDGNFTKRLSRMAYKSYHVKIAPEVMSHIGNIARDHSTAVDFQIEVTRDLNLSAAAFGHEDSCWWQSYYESRCTLKSNGGFGLRTFGTYDEVTGRAWVIPLRHDESDGTFAPTFETFEPDGFVVFNGYGNLAGYAPARLLAHLAGMTYRKVTLHASPMYVNSSAGYLVTSEALAEPFTDGAVTLDVDQHSNLFHAEKALANA